MNGAEDAIVASDLCIGYPAPRSHGPSTAREIVATEITFRLDPGQSLVVLGPNGVGKTTLLRTLIGLLPPLSGSVRLAGRDVRACSVRRRAQLVAYVPQVSRFEFAFRVRDLVAMGRAPHLRWFSAPSREDLDQADAALHRLGIGRLADANEGDLSGGERRLALIARALVQESRFLVLDEPTANLDFKNQARVLGQLVALARSGLGVIMTSHSPDHAFACGTHAALLDRSGHLSVGPVDRMITRERLSALYGVGVHILPLDERGRRACVPDLGVPA